jgi:PKD repeat protein
VINYSTDIANPNLMLSDVGSGSMVTLYSMVLNYTPGSTSISVGQASTFQAYLLRLPLQNPVYANSSVTLSIFSPRFVNSNIKWIINNESLSGKSVQYIFSAPGNYSIQLTSNNITYNMTEEVVSEPTASKTIDKNYSGTGLHDLYMPSSTGVYMWYVNGRYVEDNSSKLAYKFPYQGKYSVKVFVLNSYGSFNQSFVVTVRDRERLTSADILFFIYNTILPVIFIVYLVSNRFKSFANRNFIRIFKQLARKV